jgi:subfamily B ATP-binding cassette protein MsbA
MVPADLAALIAFGRPYRKLLSFGMALMLAESAAALALPWLGGNLASVLLDDPSHPARSTSTVLAAILTLFAVQALLKFGTTYVLGDAAERIVADLKIRAYDHLQSLPLSFFHERRHGETLALLTSDVEVISGYVSGTAVGVLPLLVTTTGAVLFMFRIEPMMALLATLLVPLFYVMIKIFGRRIRPLAQRLQEEHAAAIAIADENLGMMPAIKTFTREQQESARHRKQIDRVLHLTRQQLRISAALGPAVQFIAAAGIVLILWLASGEISGGRLTAATLVSFLLYASLLTRPVGGLADVYGRTQVARGAMMRLRRALDEITEPLGRAGSPLPPVKGEIAFEGVTFSYPGRIPALNGIELHIRAREKVAIVGPNGAGKSTLSHLLMRLHEPSGGRISLDGIDIAGASLESVRRQIGIVPQHVLLFNATVRENIAYGRPEPLQREIEAAARAARAHDFIVGLPSGYETVIGDRGVRLSGGQQQRVALARALLKDPPILILDEATAMFDPEGEIEFLRECRDAFSKRTVLLITHRPASLEIADRIVRMENGRFV